MAEQKLYLNIQEQVEKNKNDIKFILEEEGVLNQFGIKVIGQEDTAEDMPSVDDYKEDNEDWAYGDAYAIGTEAPYSLYVLTRANGTHPDDYWFNIGSFPAPGPQGEQGEEGEPGHTPQVTAAASASTLSAGSSATVLVSNIGTNDDPEFSFSFGIPKGDTGATGAAGKPGAFHINGQVASAALLPDASQVDSDAAYAVGSVLPYDIYVIMTVGGVQSWLNIGPVLTEISDTYNIADTYSTSGTLSQEQLDALVNDTNMNFLKLGGHYFFKIEGDSGYLPYIKVTESSIYLMLINTSTGVWNITGKTLVDLDSAQTITGVKKFNPNENDKIVLGATGNSYNQILFKGRNSVRDYTLGIYDNYSFSLRNYGVDLLVAGGEGTYLKHKGKIYPIDNGVNDIGESNHKYNDLYLSGKIKDGTSEFNADNVFNVINASDIVSDTLSDEQYALMTNGKPTLVIGTLLGLTNPLFLTDNGGTGTRRGFAFSGIQVVAYSINISTKAIAKNASSALTLHLNHISEINGKNIPAYPSSPTSDRSLTYKTDNTLDYIHKTSLYLHTLTFSGIPAFEIYIVSNSSTAINQMSQIINSYSNSNVVMIKSNIGGQVIGTYNDSADSNKPKFKYINGSTGNIDTYSLDGYGDITDTVTDF